MLWTLQGCIISTIACVAPRPQHMHTRIATTTTTVTTTPLIHACTLSVTWLLLPAPKSSRACNRAHMQPHLELPDRPPPARPSS